MRYLNYILMVFFFATFFATNATANGPKNRTVTFEQIESNLLIGLKSDNFGLKVSSAYFLGEYQSEQATIPLLGLLHSGTTEAERIVAALSLIKTETDRGIFAVKRAADFDESKRVRRMCKQFYYYYVFKNRNGEVKVENIELVSNTNIGNTNKLD